MKKHLLSLVLLSFLVPSVTFAAWWNPLSWFNNWGSKKEIVEEKLFQEQKTQEEKISELEKQVSELKKEQKNTMVPVVKKTEKETQSSDNSDFIQTQQKAKMEAEARTKLEQEALIVKQKEETEKQKKLEELRIEAEKQKTEKQAIQDEYNKKQQKLNEVNKKIVELNAKYLKDIENCTESLRGRGATKADLYACERPIEEKYNRDYLYLKLEFQQAKYSD